MGISRRFLTGIATASLLFVGISPVANAQSPIPSEPVSGLVVRLAKGVSPIAKDGTPTGSNLIPAKFELRSLGANYFAYDFLSPQPTLRAQGWAKRLLEDQRFLFADLDFELQTASAKPKSTFVAPPISTRKASAPRSLSATRSTASDAPTIARLRLSWRAPLSLYGADVVGYRVQYSTNGGRTYKTLIKNTQSSRTKTFVSDGLIAGESYRFRVQAITNDGSGNRVGAASSSVSASPRTTPRPVAITTLTRVGPGNVSFVEQSRADRGGFPTSSVKYRAVAKAINIDGIVYEDVKASSCNENRCRFPNLEFDVPYRVEISATNPRGTTNSTDEVSVSDEFFFVQWHLKGTYGVSMPGAWHYSRGAKDVVVAVVDSGIKPHSELASNLTKNSTGSIYGYDFVSDSDGGGDGDGWDSDPTDVGGDVNSGQLSSWHGTHVTGIVAAQTDTVGIVGVAPKVKVLPVRAIGRTGGNSSDLIAAVNWAAGERVSSEVPRNLFPAQVINLSLGATEVGPCPAGLDSAISDLVSLGVAVVAAGGNNAANSSDYFPANCSGVISVAATSSRGDLAAYSNSGSGITVSAPGGDSINVAEEASQTSGMIVSTWYDVSTETQSYGLSEGTSMATPIVSGVVALMFSIRPNLTVRQIKDIIRNSTKPFAPGGVCETSGNCGPGIINAHLALARVSGLR